MIRKIKKIFTEDWPLLLIAATTSFMLFLRLGRNVFYDWDECIYVQYGREMRLTGNWLTNQWNGLLGFEKPPGFAWMLQLPFSFGVNEFTARLTSVFFTIALLVAIYFFSKRFFSRRVAILASLLLLVSEVVIVYAIRVNTDTPFVFFIFLSLFFWVLSFKKNRFSYLSGIFLGLAVMDKGLGVLVYMAAIFLSIFLNFKKEKLWNFVLLLIAFIAIITPWHLYQYIDHGNQFIKIYFYENLVQRANNPIEFHFGGYGYYLKLLYRELWPWIFAMFVLPLYYLINLKKYSSLKAIFRELKQQEILFTIILLFILPLISLTRIQTKLPWYAMPMYPFLLIYIAYCMDFLTRQFRIKWLFYILVALLSLDAFRLIYGETRLYQSKRDIPPKYATLMAARQFQQKNLYYLVDFSERQAKTILTPNLTTSTTFIYGGNPCSIYYSDKKVYYYYSPSDFQKQIKSGHGLYLIENGDLHFIENLSLKKVYKNSDFTLFEN